MEKRFYGLLGRKLGHSYSPLIHRELGNPDYRLIELEPEDLRGFFSRENIGGVNVTIPYKVDVIEYCDHLSPETEAIGAVNTIVSRNGELWGYNTDQYGFIYMVQKAGIDFADKKVLVLGSGGASRTVRYCAQKLGAAQIIVISRKGENNYDNLDKHSDADIIVNTTPVGMYPNNGVAPLSLKHFPNCSGVVDVVYNPLRTKLIMEAEKLGIPNTGGLPMLIAQGKKAAEWFFDREIPDSETERISAKIIQSCENIVLIGMPGGGKTTVGKLLSKITGRPVMETDDMIIEEEGRIIPEIFAKDGEEAFRRLEHQAVCKAGKLSGSIIMTGGGVVTRPENYEPLHQNGRIYEIVRNMELLATEGRPLSAGGLDALRAMYEKRHPMYMAFRDAEVINETTAENAAEWIWRDFCENTCN